MSKNIHLPGLNGLRAIAALATILIAWLSYRYFESPFLRLKNRFAVVYSQNSMN